MVGHEFASFFSLGGLSALAEVRRGKAGHKIEDRCMNPCHGGQHSSMYCHLDWNYCILQPILTAMTMTMTMQNSAAMVRS